MGRTSRCSGCKVPKSEHGFGRPGPYCTGDTEVEVKIEEKQSTAKPPQNSSSLDATLLSSLVDSVKGLSDEVKAIRLETQELRSIVKPTSSQPGQSHGAHASNASQITLPELRGMRDLYSQASKKVEELGLVQSDSDSDSSCPPDTSHKSRSKKGKFKSGKEAKPTSEVLFPQFYPQSFLCLTRAQRDTKYDDLTIPEFVAGYAQILQSTDLSDLERSERAKHLVSLMYFAQQYEWSAVLNFMPPFYWR